MKTLYLVTGADGHLGSTIVRLLKKQNLPVRGLLLPGKAEPISAVSGISTETYGNRKA